jgi:hypothetical protein
MGASERSTVPAGPERFEFTFMARADTVELMEMVRDLLSHAVAFTDVDEVVRRALTVLAEDLLRKKFALTDKPRTAASGASSGEPSASVKREVYLRDGGRCTRVSKDGRRCGSRRFLQFDHVGGRFVAGDRPRPPISACGARPQPIGRGGALWHPTTRA